MIPNMLLPLAILLLCVPSFAQSATDKAEHDAVSEVIAIRKALPAYEDDAVLAPMETDAIHLVQRDIAILDDAIDSDDFVRHVRKLEKDWHDLVRLDNYLETIGLT